MITGDALVAPALRKHACQRATERSPWVREHRDSMEEIRLRRPTGGGREGWSVEKRFLSGKSAREKVIEVVVAAVDAACEPVAARRPPPAPDEHCARWPMEWSRPSAAEKYRGERGSKGWRGEHVVSSW